jgi:hypothetical protein
VIDGIAAHGLGYDTARSWHFHGPQAKTLRGDLGAPFPQQRIRQGNVRHARSGGDMDFANLRAVLPWLVSSLPRLITFSRHFTGTCGIILFGRPLANQFYRAYSSATGLGVQCTLDCPASARGQSSPPTCCCLSPARGGKQSQRVHQLFRNNYSAR